MSVELPLLPSAPPGLLTALAGLAEWASGAVSWQDVLLGPFVGPLLSGRPQAADTKAVIAAYDDSAYKPLHWLAQDLSIALANGAPISDSRPEVQATFSRWKQGTTTTITKGLPRAAWWLALNVMDHGLAQSGGGPSAVLPSVRVLDQIYVWSQQASQVTIIPVNPVQPANSTIPVNPAQPPSIRSRVMTELSHLGLRSQAEIVTCILLSEQPGEAVLCLSRLVASQLASHALRIIAREIETLTSAAWSRLRTEVRTRYPDPPVPRLIEAPGTSLRKLDPRVGAGVPHVIIGCGCDTPSDYEEGV